MPRLLHKERPEDLRFYVLPRRSSYIVYQAPAVGKKRDSFPKVK